MALKVPKGGQMQLFKDGYKRLSGMSGRYSTIQDELRVVRESHHKAFIIRLASLLGLEIKWISFKGGTNYAEQRPASIDLVKTCSNGSYPRAVVHPNTQDDPVPLLLALSFSP